MKEKKQKKDKLEKEQLFTGWEVTFIFIFNMNMDTQCLVKMFKCLRVKPNIASQQWKWCPHSVEIEPDFSLS